MEITTAEFKELFYNNTNLEVAAKLKISKSMVSQIAKKLGFNKLSRDKLKLTFSDFKKPIWSGR